MLLLLAPCSVRNHIGTLVGLEKSEVFNKSKATLQEITHKAFCSADDWRLDGADVNRIVFKNHTPASGLLGSSLVQEPASLVAMGIMTIATKKIAFGHIPFYLLYGNLKLGGLIG